MANDSTGKASSGSPFRPPSAQIWNGMVDAGIAFSGSQLSSGPPRPTRPRETDLLKLKNSSEADRRRGEILKIDGGAITDVTAEHIWLDGIEPTDDCRFGILKDPAEADEVVTAQVSGVGMALVNIVDADHTFATVVAEEYVLESSESGPLEILYAPSGTGEKECIVLFAVARPLIVEMTETVGPGKAGTARVQKITNDTGTLASGDTITLADADPVRNIIVVNFRPNWLATGIAYIAHPIAGFWVIENDACFQDFMS